MPVSVARWLSSIIEKAVLFFGITLHNPLQQVRRALHKVDKTIPPSRLEHHGVNIKEMINANKKQIQSKAHTIITKERTREAEL